MPGFTTTAAPHGLGRGTRITPRQALGLALEAIRDEGDERRLRELVRTMAGRRLPAPAVLERFRVLISILEERDELAAGLYHTLRKLVGSFDCVPALAESGIPVWEGFWAGVTRHVAYSVLPPVFAAADLRGLVQRTFKKCDAPWIAALGATDLLPALIRVLLRAEGGFAQNEQLVRAACVLGYRISALALESELATRVPESERVQRELFDLPVALHRCIVEHSVDEREWDRLQECLARAETLARYLRVYHRAHGTSPRMTVLTLRLKLQIRRVRDILRLLGRPAGESADDLARIVAEILSFEIVGSTLRAYVRETTLLLALEVTGHGAHHGTGYIMQSARDYWRFFVRSAQAGVLVAFFGNLKLLLPHELPPFFRAAVYSLNYAACFVLIYVTGSALATKQPAMTAATVAETLDVSGSDEVSVQNLGLLVRRVLRSQLVSFAGNLAVVLPLPFLAAYGLRRAFGLDFISHEQAYAVLRGLQPIASGSLLFAALTGVWLFVSGLVTGYIDNHVLFGRIAERLAQHPVLTRLLSAQRRDAVARFIDDHLGAIAGNVAFGVLLGSTAVVAGFFGLPLDIRHITFSAAQFAVSVEVLMSEVPLRTYALVLATVLGIGFINFLVSFSLALVTAMKSRGLPLSDLKALFDVLRGRAPALNVEPPLLPQHGPARKSETTG